MIDSTDVSLVEKHKWRSKKWRSLWYATAYLPHVGTCQKELSMHRLIMDAKPGQMIDHINRNGLDNRRRNLRFCTNSQNQANSIARNKHGVKGVVFDKRCTKNPWQARIVVNQEVILLGSHKTKEEAGAAYDASAVEHFGEFARLNYPAGNLTEPRS